MANGISYVLWDEKEIVGFARCVNDSGYGIYVFDLLVDKKSRGQAYGRMLLEQVCKDFPDVDIYVTSDVDIYYV